VEQIVLVFSDIMIIVWLFVQHVLIHVSDVQALLLHYVQPVQHHHTELYKLMEVAHATQDFTMMDLLLFVRHVTQNV
jgi:hypothetical protein